MPSRCYVSALVNTAKMTNKAKTTKPTSTWQGTQASSPVLQSKSADFALLYYSNQFELNLTSQTNINSGSLAGTNALPAVHVSYAL